MLAILIICLVIFGAISLPIGIAMGLATMLCLVFATNIDPIMVAQNAFAGIDSFSLMAIPFFMLAGNFMRYGGISKRLLDLADNIVGFFTGGLGAITTFTAMFYAAISGSGPATVSAIGSFMIPEMEEKGYDKGYATALSAAAGTIGVIIPPSIPFVIYGVATGTSIGDMFKAGVIPGLLMGLLLMNVFLLVVGMFMDNISSCTILAPILLPVAVALGVNPVHFGIVMTMNLAIGFITPPYGVNLFVGSSVAHIPFERIVKWIWPFIGVIIVVLLLTTYIPQLSLLLV